MEIYGDSISGNCLKVRYTADHLGMPYTWHEVDLMSGETRTSSFLEMNPAGQVPVVVLPDKRSLAQSNAIIGYLAEGSSLLPEDNYERARVYEWMFWEQYSHEPYIAVLRFHMKYLGKSVSEREAWRVERGESALDLMESALSGSDWIAGNSFTIADIALLAYTRLAHEGGFDLEPRRSIQRWIDRCENKLGLDPT